MSIFNSLGSNYDFDFVLKSLFSNTSMYHSRLHQLLKDKYGGNVVLLYKGREAIELALRSLNLPKDSHIAINGFTCFAVYEAVKNAGLNLEYLDIDRGELNFSAETLREALEKNPKVKAVIIQNTLGYPCEIAGIEKICKDKNLVLIEDLAHSIGTKYENGEEAGTVGDFTVLSFSQDKMIDGISGGALISKAFNNSVVVKREGAKLDHLEGELDSHLKGIHTNQQLIDKFYPLFTYIIRGTYPFLIGKIFHEILKRLNLLSKPMPNIDGYHILPSWYSNLISAQFQNLDENLNHRKTIASIYAKNINPKILSPKIVDKIHLSSNLRFPIFITDRENLIKYLAKNQIYVSDIWYDAPVAPKKFLSQTDYQDQCPNSELAASAILNLPTHINVSEKDAQKISSLINQWLTSQ